MRTRIRLLPIELLSLEATGEPMDRATAEVLVAVGIATPSMNIARVKAVVRKSTSPLIVRLSKEGTAAVTTRTL